VLGLVQKQLRSVMSTIQGVIVVEEKGQDVAANRKSVLLPNSAAPVCCKESNRILNTSDTHIQGKSKGKGRVGKGTHGLSIVRHLLADKEKWIIPKEVRDPRYLIIFGLIVGSATCLLIGPAEFITTPYELLSVLISLI